jgi:hypothetical protein
MKYSKLASASAVLFAVVLSSSSATLTAREAPLPSFTLATAHAVTQQCRNACFERYRSCLSLKMIPTSECRGVRQDCVRYTCNAVQE